MSYEKQTWAKGDVVTSAKLNHMEDGIADGGGGAFVVTFTGSNPTAVTVDKTYAEILQAYQNGIPITAIQDVGYGTNHVFPCVTIMVGETSEIRFSGLVYTSIADAWSISSFAIDENDSVTHVYKDFT